MLESVFSFKGTKTIPPSVSFGKRTFAVEMLRGITRAAEIEMAGPGGSNSLRNLHGCRTKRHNVCATFRSTVACTPQNLCLEQFVKEKNQ